MQAAINVWHRQCAGKPHDAAAYQCFLSGIGYLLPEGPDFTIETSAWTRKSPPWPAPSSWCR